jgi:hypothetical protein
MMLQFSQVPKPPQPSDSDSAFEAWREYAARVSQAIRERREDAYEESARNDAGNARVSPLKRNSN